MKYVPRGILMPNYLKTELEKKLENVQKISVKGVREGQTEFFSRHF